jgi:putative CocE/NonD family hydrolase
MTALRATVAAVLGLALVPAGASAATAKCNVSIRMSDGVVLRANVWLPSTAGRYPTVLTATGYNKDTSNPTGSGCSGSGGIATADTSLVDKGYAVMLLDDRGTGASEGKWTSWDERTQLDYREVLDWIQGQDWSDGSVATTGGSYMGITSFLLAEADAARVAAGKPRAVKAVWADVPMSDAYRDVTFHGGAVDSGFIPLWLGLTTGLSDLPPSTLTSSPLRSAKTYADHLRNGYDFAARKIVETTLGEDSAYDGPFYRVRSPGDRAGQISVPVVITGGWWDIFQRGEPRLYEQLTQLTSATKKIFMSPHYHTTSGPAAEDSGLKLKWFDHWLKGVDNGVENTPSVNLYPVNGTSWEHFSTWPVPDITYKKLFLSGAKSGSARSLHDGSLSASSPAGFGDESAPLLPASSPCTRLTAQWTAGAAALAPCETDNRTFEASSLTYTSGILDSDLQLTGPIVANVYAKLSSADATLVAVLSDVNSSGASNQVTAGFLLASQRAVDPDRSTFGPGGEMIRPFHPFTRASQRAVPKNVPQLYRIEIYPTDAIWKKGDRIRLTIGTADTPATSTPLPDLVHELGGQVTILHGGGFDSHVLLPVRG